MFGLVQRQIHQAAPKRLSYQTVRVGAVLMFLLAGAAGTLIWRQNASAALADSTKRNLPPGRTTQPAGSETSRLTRANYRALARGGSFSFFPPDGETIEVFAGDCVTPKSSFELGEVVCVKVTNAPVAASVLRRFSWSTRERSTVRTTDIVTSTQTDTFTLPSTPFSTLGMLTVDNRAVWKVATIDTSDNSLRTAVVFTVHDPAAPSADLSVNQGSNQTNGVQPDTDVNFDVTVINNGPDTAQGVTLGNSFPPNTAFGSVMQTSGQAFDCTTASGVTSCVAQADFPQNAKATFRFTYHVNAGTPVSTIITNEVTVSGTTAEVDSNDNDSLYNIPVTAEGSPPSGCAIACPNDVNQAADTTDSGNNPGTVVHFGTPTTNGDCGTLTIDHCNDCFFPVGTTVVTVSGNGDTCSFNVNVSSPQAPTISCPANKIGDAGSNCNASFNLGTPNVSGGQNTTIVVSRSDGLPMYDCDTNGEHCVRKTTDLPFSAGVSTVTWIAYSHDTAGPYANSDDEEAHRTGSASCTQTVTVYDVTPPTIISGDVTASADGNCQATVPDFSSSATVSDNCACASSDTSQICDTRQDIAITQDVAPGTLLGLGPHTINLTANDGAVTPGPDGIIGTSDDVHGNTAVKTITFTVVDTTAPAFTFVPANVTAYTGAGATTCDTVVDPGMATATDNCGPVTITRSPSGNTFPVGATTITWTAKDGANNITTATQTVTVIDNTPPVITLNGNTPSMWPPNHKYQTFTVTNFVTSVFDNCGGVSVSNVVIDHVTSDETENGNGDGNTTNDIVIASDCKSLQLRSERDGGGDGRVYTITFRLTDTHGNTTTVTANVVVPHNPGETPVNSGVHYTVNGTCP